MHTLVLLALTYVLVGGDSNNLMSSNVDINRAIAVRDRYGAHFLWVKRDGVGYVIRDAATLDAIDRLFEPSRAFSPELERLRAKMRPLEKRENRLDKEIDAIEDMDEGVTQSDRARLRDLKHEMRDVQVRLREYEREEESLDRRQDRLEQEAEERMIPLVDEAIRKGVAKRD